MSGPLPEHATQPHQTIAHHPRKGSDHDRNHHDPEDDGRTGDGRTNGDGTPDGDRADRPDGDGNQPDTHRPRRTRQSTAVRRSQRTGHGAAPRTPTRPSERDGGDTAPVTSQATVTLTAAPDGAVWVVVDGADLQEVTSRIGMVCDALTRARPPRE